MAAVHSPSPAANIVPREVTQARLDRRSAIAGKYRASSAYTMADLLEQRTREQGPRPLLHYGERRWSYAQANAEANRVAHALRGLGIQRGDVVALAMENRPEFFFTWFGLAKLGAVVAFLNTHIGGRALAHALQAVQAKVAIVGDECLAAFDADEVRAQTPRVPLWRWPDAERPASDALRALADERAWQAAQGADTSDPAPTVREGLTAGQSAVYIFTSGTTGLPKAAIISHARWLMTGEVMAETMSIGADDCFYTFLPLYHGAASISAGATSLFAGGALALRRKFSRREFWSDVRRYHATVCQYVGEICRYLLAEAPRADDRQHSLRKMVGAGLSAETWQRFVERFGEFDIYEGWGATEANANTINVDNRIGSCGRIPYWEKTNLRLVRYDVETDSHPRDAAGKLIVCQPGEVGEAIGRAHFDPEIIAARFEGYTSAAATEGKLLRGVFEPGDAWWASGDLLRYDEDGYCWFVDRIGDTYRWKSENVSTTEVADAFADLDGVESVTVYGVQVPGTEGRAGMAAVVMQTGRAFDPQTFYARAAARLPRYAMPIFVRVPAAADMTTTYKLRKVDLQRQGFDAAQVGDPLFVRDDAARRYVPLTPEAVQRALAA